MGMNLVESYDRLMNFGKKHLPDNFFLENDKNKSLRNIILREMISNVLMHREFSSSYTAKFVVEKDKMYVENANRSTNEGCITEDNLEPNSKNPLIASFFRNIGYADQLGSGVRNLFKYSKYYSGKKPEFLEGDVFRIIVPLDEGYSYDFGQVVSNLENADKMPINADKVPINTDKNLENLLSEQQKQVFQYVKENGKVTSHQVEELLCVKQRRARIILNEMTQLGLLVKQGSYKTTVYVMNKESDSDKRIKVRGES